jgi:poly(A) polymerase
VAKNFFYRQLWSQKHQIATAERWRYGYNHSMTHIVSLSNPDLPHFDWLQAADLQRLFAVFADAGAEIRVVGGAVRNALLDLAVNRPPEQAEQILLQAGIKTVRTGFAHGTITAVLHGHGYEITSLRHDVATDGRHASVAYTDVWHDDAARRDFTFNALYVAADGQLYDYFGGVADLSAGIVRFIGVAADRIAEDYLRILRFFRFHAAYGRGTLEPEGLAACTNALKGMAQLSRERVTQEWKKLLLTDTPCKVLPALQESGVLGQIIPLTLNLPRLQRLLDRAEPSGFAVRLAALLPDDRLVEPVLRASLRLSAADLQHVLDLAKSVPSVTEDTVSADLYYHGQTVCHDRLLLQVVDGVTQEEGALLQRIAAWRRPYFPLKGEDILALGVAPSPAVGKLLKAVEAWWVAADFKPDHAACLEQVKQQIRLQ